MTVVEALTALRSVAPFDRISDGGLALLLEAVAIQSYAGGESVQTGTSVSPRLQIVIAGSVTDRAGAVVGPVLGLAGMFTDVPPPALMAAVSSGASVVTLDRQAFFTLARASPKLVRGFLEVGPGGGASKVSGSRVLTSGRFNGQRGTPFRCFKIVSESVSTPTHMLRKSSSG